MFQKTVRVGSSAVIYTHSADFTKILRTVSTDKNNNGKRWRLDIPHTREVRPVTNERMKGERNLTSFFDAASRRFLILLVDVMHCNGSAHEAEGIGPRVFATTHWSVVIAAGNRESAPAQRA